MSPSHILGSPALTAGSTQPSSIWFGAGVPCKVRVSLFFGPAHFVLLKYELLKCFANFYSVFISLCKVFLAGDAGYERTVREDRTDFAWAAEREGPYWAKVGL